MGYECTFNCVTGTFMRTTDINSTSMLVQSRRICGSIMGLPEIVGNSFIRLLLVTDNMFEHRLHLSKIGHTFLNGVSLSDLIWTYVVTGAYCLVQGRVWRFYQRWKFSCDPLSSVVNLTTEVGNHMWIVSVCYQQWSVWPPLREELRRYVKQRCAICAVSSKSAATTPIPRPTP